MAGVPCGSACIPRTSHLNGMSSTRCRWVTEGRAWTRVATMNGSNELVVASRWTTAQSWWIASELCRRNSSLLIEQDFDDGARRLQVRRDLPREAGGGGARHAPPQARNRGRRQVTVDQLARRVRRRRCARSGYAGSSGRAIGRCLRPRLRRAARSRIASSLAFWRPPSMIVSIWSRCRGRHARVHSPRPLVVVTLQRHLRSSEDTGRSEDPRLWVLFRGSPKGVLVISEAGVAYRRDGPLRLTLQIAIQCADGSTMSCTISSQRDATGSTPAGDSPSEADVSHRTPVR